MTSDKLIECQKMFRHACAFAECADIAREKFQHDTADIDWYITPSVVNSAFACEVYLKALLLFHDIKFEDHLKGKKRHEIKELYGLLPEDTRDRVKQTAITNGGNWEDPFGFERIDNISDAFMKWRYSYEHDWCKSSIMKIDVGFLTAFRDALREACCQLFFKKTWKAYSTN